MIYHVTEEEYWHSQKNKGYTSATFAEEGFIHCSNEDQLEGVLMRYYKGKLNLILLHIDEKALKSKLIYEPSTGGELFPHIYGPINLEAIVKTERLK